MGRTLIKNATIVNEGHIQEASVLIKDDLIEHIFTEQEPITHISPDKVVDASGKWLLPGVIDDHVHFREPGLTHKADMESESLAAAAGGVTTVFDMPNCIPQTVTMEAIQEKFRIASSKCVVNHSFYLGATSENIGLIADTDPESICGIKLFMGSSTGGMLLNDAETLLTLFRSATVPIAAHCEEQSIIEANLQRFKRQLGGEPPVEYHSLIRSNEACYASTSRALDIAAGTDARLHILHISTARELALFTDGPLEGKQFTAEACPAHLWFTESDYASLGTLIKCNPSVKTAADREALRTALTNGVIDVIGTDHAPHLLSEKQGGCLSAASGLPVLPYSLIAMLELCDEGIMQPTQVVQLMCHNPAILFSVKQRGFIRQGYKADLTLLSHCDSEESATTAPNPGKCGWNPFTGMQFHWKVETTWVNGHTVYDQGRLNTKIKGERIQFKR